MLKTIHKTLIIISLTLFFNTCKNKERQIEPAFYHWKSKITLTDFEKKYTAGLNIKKYYIRLFDVDWDVEQRFPKPLARIDNFTPSVINTLKAVDDIKITPTVFITNEIFKQIADNQLDTLSFLILNKINEITEGVKFDEIQLDCDWTQSTRDKFFLFLNKIKKEIEPKKLSITLRLHQVKDREKMGIPPVERAMLMCYNMANLDNSTTENSILDPVLLRGYLKTIKTYPIDLDVALPLFSWGIVLRDGEAIKIINNLNVEDLDSIFIKKSENRYILTKNTYFKSHYLYENDEIRLEYAPLSYLEETADFLSQNIRNQHITISFYHLDSTVLKRYTYENLENIISRFK